MYWFLFVLNRSWNSYYSPIDCVGTESFLRLQSLFRKQKFGTVLMLSLYLDSGTPSSPFLTTTLTNKYMNMEWKKVFSRVYWILLSFLSRKIFTLLFPFSPILYMLLRSVYLSWFYEYDTRISETIFTRSLIKDLLFVLANEPRVLGTLFCLGNEPSRWQSQDSDRYLKTTRRSVSVVTLESFIYVPTLLWGLKMRGLSIVLFVLYHFRLLF